MPRGDKEHMMKFSIMVPSLPEQQKIADFLSTIDTIIEKQRATVLAWEERKKRRDAEVVQSRSEIQSG